jgi:transcriptional regulator with XRE-family HTH domain
MIESERLKMNIFNFGNELKAKRKTLGLTRSQLAKELNVNVLTIWRWETGKTFPNQNISTLKTFLRTH